MASRDRNTFDELVKIQQNMNNLVIREMEEDREIELISLINEETNEDKPTQLEKIILAAASLGYSEPTVLDVIERLKRQSIVFQPSPGYLQKVK